MDIEKSERAMDKELYKAAVEGDESFLTNNVHDEDYFLRQTCQGNNYLHIAIRSNKCDFIKVALWSFPGQNDGIAKLLLQRNRNGNTPLHVAAEVGDIPIINLLLEFKGAGEDETSKLWREKNDMGNTPLHVAFIYGNFEVAEVLLSKVHDPQLARAINESNQTPLHLAIKFQAIGDKKQTVKLFNILDPHQAAAMVKLLQGAHLLPIVKLLLQIDSSVACWRDSSGWTPLLIATSLEAPHDLEVVKEILRHHPQSAEVYDHSGKTILHHLNRKLSYPEAKELLEFPEMKFLVKYRDHNGNTPAHAAACNKDFNFVRVLQESSANFLMVNNEGVSAADLLEQNKVYQDYVISEDFVDGILKLTGEERRRVMHLDEELLKGRLDREGRLFLLSRTTNRENILHLLIYPFLYDMDFARQEFGLTYIKDILDMYPDLLCQTDHIRGDTPVHCLATHLKRSEAFDQIADIFDDCSKRAGFQSPWLMQNADGNTPLHLSISATYTTSQMEIMFKVWRRDRSAVAVTNKRLEFPVHLLPHIEIVSDPEPEWQESLVELLKHFPVIYGALLEHDVDGVTPFLRAVQSCHTYLVRMYLTHFLNSVIYQKRKDDGNTALHISLEMGRFDYAELILSTKVPFLTYELFSKRMLTVSELRYRKELLDIPNSKGDTPTSLISSLEHLPSSVSTGCTKALCIH